MFANMKIGIRLGVGFATTLLLLIAIAVVSYTRLASLNHEVETLAKVEFPKTVEIAKVSEALATVSRQLRNAYIYSRAEQQKSLDAIQEQSKIISSNLEQLDKAIPSGEGRDLLNKVVAARTDFVSTEKKITELIKTGDKAPVVTLMQGDLRQAQTDYSAAVSSLTAYQTELVNQTGANADALAATAEKLIVIMGVVAGLLTIHPVGHRSRPENASRCRQNDGR